MTYGFKCTECGVEKEVDAPMLEGPPKDVRCPSCKHKMVRMWGEQATIIPEHMRASGDSVSPTAIGTRMNRSRPSGKRRTLW